MVLEGRLFKGTVLLKQAETRNSDAGQTFHKRLEDCFVRLCKMLEIPVPVWMKKNTAEFSKYRKTFFSSDQFIDTVFFDRFDVRIEL